MATRAKPKTQPVEPATPAPVVAEDKNQREADGILAWLQRYGIEPAGLMAQIRPQASIQALVTLLVAAGVLDQGAYEAAFYAQLAGALRTILQQVEESRLAAAEQTGKPQIVKPRLYVAGRE